MVTVRFANSEPPRVADNTTVSASSSIPSSRLRTVVVTDDAFVPSPAGSVSRVASIS